MLLIYLYYGRDHFKGLRVNLFLLLSEEFYAVYHYCIRRTTQSIIQISYKSVRMVINNKYKPLKYIVAQYALNVDVNWL